MPLLQRWWPIRLVSCVNFHMLLMKKVMQMKRKMKQLRLINSMGKNNKFKTGHRCHQRKGLHCHQVKIKIILMMLSLRYPGYF